MLPPRFPPLPPRPPKPDSAQDFARYQCEKQLYERALDEHNEACKTHLAITIVLAAICMTAFFYVSILLLWNTFGARGLIAAVAAVLAFTLAVYEVRRFL